VKFEKMTHSVGHSERKESLLSHDYATQWFVRMEPLCKRKQIRFASLLKIKLILYLNVLKILFKLDGNVP